MPHTALVAKFRPQSLKLHLYDLQTLSGNKTDPAFIWPAALNLWNGYSQLERSPYLIRLYPNASSTFSISCDDEGSSPALTPFYLRGVVSARSMRYRSYTRSCDKRGLITMRKHPACHGSSFQHTIRPTSLGVPLSFTHSIKPLTVLRLTPIRKIRLAYLIRKYRSSQAKSANLNLLHMTSVLM